jgi:predicted metal-dependent hydrolase
MQSEQITYGSTTINYSLDFAERKSLGIKVYPDKSVAVTAPINASIEKINEKIHSKAAWIIKQQDFFLSFHPLTPTRKFVSGETHLYLGKQYRLKLSESKDESVKLQAGNIYINTTNKEDNTYIEKQLKEWYKQKAEIHFNKLFDTLKPIANKLTDLTPSLKYRWMDKRWGSCNKKAEIILNLELIKAPKKCIEYVIIHELCHLTHMNHSNKFYELINETLPNWKKTKQQLEHIMV